MTFKLIYLFIIFVILLFAIIFKIKNRFQNIYNIDRKGKYQYIKNANGRYILVEDTKPVDIEIEHFYNGFFSKYVIVDAKTKILVIDKYSSLTNSYKTPADMSEKLQAIYEGYKERENL